MRPHSNFSCAPRDRLPNQLSRDGVDVDGIDTCTAHGLCLTAAANGEEVCFAFVPRWRDCHQKDPLRSPRRLYFK